MSGSIKTLEFELESIVSSGEHQTMTLSARTVGGPPTGVWRRNDVVIESDDPDFTITFELDKSKEHFTSQVPYTSRLRSHGRTEGIFSYSVTNRVTPKVSLVENMIIEGMCTGSAGSIDAIIHEVAIMHEPQYLAGKLEN